MGPPGVAPHECGPIEIHGMARRTMEIKMGICAREMAKDLNGLTLALLKMVRACRDLAWARAEGVSGHEGLRGGTRGYGRPRWAPCTSHRAGATSCYYFLKRSCSFGKSSSPHVPVMGRVCVPVLHNARTARVAAAHVAARMPMLPEWHFTQQVVTRVVASGKMQVHPSCCCR